MREYPRYLVDGVMVAEVTKGTSLLPSSTLKDILILNGWVIVILNFANYLWHAARKPEVWVLFAPQLLQYQCQYPFIKIILI